MSRNLEKKVRDKYGRVHGGELKEIVLDEFAPPWGPRYTTSPVRDPTIENLTPTVLRKLLRDK